MGLKTGADWLEEVVEATRVEVKVFTFCFHLPQDRTTTHDSKIAQALPEVVPTALKKRRCNRCISRSSINNAWWNFVSAFSAKMVLFANLNVCANTDPKLNMSYVKDQRAFCREGYDVFHACKMKVTYEKTRVHFIGCRDRNRAQESH